MSKTVGFIGGGNMAEAIIGGMIKTGLYKSEQILVADVSKDRLNHVSMNYGVKVETENRTVSKAADILILAVKPQYYGEVIREIKDHMSVDTVVVTIAAGKTMASTVESFDIKDLKVIRVMPNTPALVGEGMSGIAFNLSVEDDELSEVVAIFRSFGKAEILPERLMDVVTGVSGSGPAYIFMIIEAMADGAVADGMPRHQAYTFAAQTVLGAAKMVLETGMQPGQLKDMVTSPGGTTIEAIAVLEDKGLRSTMISGVRTATAKSKALGK